MNNKSYQPIKNTLFPLIGAALGFFWILFSRVPESDHRLEQVRAPQVNFQAPSFSLPALDGSEFVIDDLSNRPLVLNFWASWCPPCKAEMPAFQLASEEYSETDLIIVAINATNQDSIENAKSFLEKEKISLLVLLDSIGSTSKAYNVHSLPTTFFIDRQGTISKILIGGPVPLALLRTEIDNILQE